ncbi:MAG: iron-sulfur cluster assembly scaffold protein [Firmicutes bacterium]|jgi:nitrogen fixation NifU-like protein|nr:iron-sulfur cluster assembly scaffold protein [Bacillota bacterium]
MYTDIAIDHFTNPRNVGVLEDADGIGMAGDPECGDYLKIFLKVEDDFITDIKFQVHGCAGAISSSSMTTEMAKGLPIMAAFAITEHDIVNKLGGLPEEKIHCSLLGAMALKKAIVDYAQNRKK